MYDYNQSNTSNQITTNYLVLREYFRQDLSACLSIQKY